MPKSNAQLQSVDHVDAPEVETPPVPPVTVEPEPGTTTEGNDADLKNALGPDLASHVIDDEDEDDDEAPPAFAFAVLNELPADLPKARKAPSPAIHFGFDQLPKNGVVLIPADKADRARANIQNVKAKFPDRKFITHQAKGLSRHPTARKGDIEIVRLA